MAKTVRRIVLDYVHGRVKDELWATEAISAAASVVGERCIEAARELPVRAHDFPVGQRILSDKVNALLAGESPTDSISSVPKHSVFGVLRDALTDHFVQADFPSLRTVFGSFAGGIGKPEDWGRVPLSLPRDRWPGLLPLRVAFDTRVQVDRALAAFSQDKPRSLRVCTLALAAILNECHDKLDRHLALVLALETVNGMAKTAPMTTKPIDKPTRELEAAQREVVKLGAP